jgi:hypothetical protein
MNSLKNVDIAQLEKAIRDLQKSLMQIELTQKVEQLQKQFKQLVSGEPEKPELTLQQQNEHYDREARNANRSPMQENFDREILIHREKRIMAENELLEKQTREEFEAELYQTGELNKKIDEFNKLRQYAKAEEKRVKI